MPLEYRVVPRRAVLISATGTVIPSECEALVALLLEEPAIEEVLPVLVDVRGAGADVSTRDLVHFATLARMPVKRGMDLVAITVDPGPMLTLARTFEVAARAVGVHVAVFDSYEQARVWLRLRDDLDVSPGSNAPTGSTSETPIAIRSQ
jgi:hypothetical protein